MKKSARAVSGLATAPVRTFSEKREILLFIEEIFSHKAEVEGIESAVAVIIGVLPFGESCVRASEQPFLSCDEIGYLECAAAVHVAHNGSGDSLLRRKFLAA